ncbi:MAG: elongation factor P [Armatimonadota bacterium]|nr:elongation factor P [Armatimonadota bacterium]
MVTPNDFKPGLTIELDGRVLQVVQADHHRQGRGDAIVRTRLRDVETGEVFQKTFRSNEDVETAHVDRRDFQYLYTTGETYVFMDMETYEQRELTRDILGENVKWLKEGETVQFALYEGKIVGMEIDKTVDRRVTQTDPGLRGDTTQGGSKPATIEGGAVVQVPLFVQTGDVLRVDTETGEYVGRVES